MNDQLNRYLEKFASSAREAGLDAKRPGQNWVALKNLVPGSHVSMSASANQIQVNLNNEKDENRAILRKLYAERDQLQATLSETLDWDQKEGRKKTAVRATFDSGYSDESDWERQHKWAIETMKKFEKEFGRRI